MAQAYGRVSGRSLRFSRLCLLAAFLPLYRSNRSIHYRKFVSSAQRPKMTTSSKNTKVDLEACGMKRWERRTHPWIALEGQTAANLWNASAVDLGSAVAPTLVSSDRVSAPDDSLY
ncbi:hypothetical protein M441DRAFT_23194 [Trichoderma asperellum CBS 433.97]|uniref:Uncharacterized protein n=1 Tax=Trichoderma asperellum (strain ATCC 204424 / CBS 433.97 / NBRC 101777) TaxID=1042311 RepID=A0A2T3ZJ86_TRIA4|nr:hypothetical protein M441DRAFT_23194 [Trichoderma asperellum CBS 433.97]PTB44867.1 hypothetical protein M441DRAFT_23194 [Trichoderma asperellum CBS 433.97]